MKFKYTLITYEELVWASPFNWHIYKISAQLYVKQVENHMMKMKNKFINFQLGDHFSLDRW